MEIERKFLVRKLPDLSAVSPISYERYFLRAEDSLEERIQKKGDIYEYEIKKVLSPFQRTKDKKRISKEEFEKLKEGKEGIIRDGYPISSSPDISIKIYHGRFKGLIRAEVEFESKEEAERYIPEQWMGRDITLTVLSRDARLLHLSPEEFQSLLRRESGPDV